MDKYREDRELFIRALEEAICNRFDKIIAESPATAECSKEHEAKMRFILNGGDPYRKNRLSKAKLIAALVAAALLLTGCTLYVFRNQIKGFVEYIYETYISVTREVEDPYKDEIKEVYRLTYIPEGYELVSENVTAAQVNYRWKNISDQHLHFVQTASTGKYFIDTKEGYTLIVEYNGINIYLRQNQDTCNYAWCHNGYYFRLVSYVNLPTEELTLILDGMRLKN